MVSGSRTNRIQLLAAGEFPLSVAGGNTLQRFVSQGAPIDWVPLEPVLVEMNTIMLSTHASHPNAGKLFIDFVLSKKGQEMIRGFYRIPPRNDVDADPPRLFKGFKRIVEDVEEHENVEAIVNLYFKIFTGRKSAALDQMGTDKNQALQGLFPIKPL